MAARRLGLRGAGFCGALCATVFTAMSAAASPPPGYVLSFNDEFDGTTLDTSKWLRLYKWGEAVINNELEAYVDDAFALNAGILDIVGTNAPGTYAGQTFAYRSGVICSFHSQTYGYFEARLRMPLGKGLWPAFWLLGEPGTQGVNEIDIQEFIGDKPNVVYLTVHWGASYSPPDHQADGTSFTGPDFTLDFHTFAVEWTPTDISWLVDGVERHHHSGDGVPQVPMYLIANLAIGGDWPGAPDSTTQFPALYAIDYIRAYTKDLDAENAGTAGTGGTADSGAVGTGGGATGGSSSGATGGLSNGGSAGSSGGSAGSSTGTGGSGGSIATGGAKATSGGSSQTNAASSTESGGCGCRASSDETTYASLVAAAVLACAARFRRRRHGRWSHLRAPPFGRTARRA